MFNLGGPDAPVEARAPPGLPALQNGNVDEDDLEPMQVALTQASAGFRSQNSGGAAGSADPPNLRLVSVCQPAARAQRDRSGPYASRLQIAQPVQVDEVPDAVSLGDAMASRIRMPMRLNPPPQPALQHPSGPPRPLSPQHLPPVPTDGQSSRLVLLLPPQGIVRVREDTLEAGDGSTRVIDHNELDRRLRAHEIQQQEDAIRLEAERRRIGRD